MTENLSFYDSNERIREKMKPSRSAKKFRGLIEIRRLLFRLQSKEVPVYFPVFPIAGSSNQSATWVK